MKKRTKILLILLVALMILILPGFYNALAIRYYTVETPGIARPIHIALITDLHSCAYGDGQRELLEAIDAEAPDFILLGGDIFDDDMPVAGGLCFCAAGREGCETGVIASECVSIAARL